MQSVGRLIAKVREFITPKQHVLTWIDDVRRNHSLSAYFEDERRQPLHEWSAVELTKAVFRGAQRWTARLDRKQQHEELWKAMRDYNFLRNLISRCNDMVAQSLLAAGPEGAHLARILEMLIMRESFAASAERAVALIGEASPAVSSKRAAARGAAVEAVVAELDIYTLRPTCAGAEPGVRNTYRHLLLQSYFGRLWRVRCGLVALLEQIYAHQLLEELIAFTYFSKHPILYPENERRLSRTVKWLGKVAAEFNRFVLHRIAPLIDEEPKLARVITGTQSAGGWHIDLAQVRKDAAALCPELLALSKKEALGQALLTMGERNEAVRVLATRAEDDHSVSVADEARWKRIRATLQQMRSEEGPPA